MKIAVITDTHASNAPGTMEALRKQASEIIEEIKPDALIHLGDVGENPYFRELLFELYRDAEFNKFVIPGNHDYWCQFGPGKENMQRMHDAAKENGWGWLNEEVSALTELDREWVDEAECIIVGRGMSFDGTLYPMDRDKMQMAAKWCEVNDGVHTRFPWRQERDPWGFYESEARFLESNLRLVQAMLLKHPSKVLVIATHVPTHESLQRTDFLPDDLTFIFGCSAYEEIIKPFIPGFLEKGVEKIHILAGHTHGPAFWQDPDFGGQVTLRVCESDYGAPQTFVLELAKVA